MAFVRVKDTDMNELRGYSVFVALLVIVFLGCAPSSPTNEQQPRASSSTQARIVFVTRTGAKYHRSSCRYLSKSKIPMVLTEAKTFYSPCKVCKP